MRNTGGFPEDEETRRARAPQVFPEAEAEELPTGGPEVDDHNGDVEAKTDEFVEAGAPEGEPVRQRLLIA